MDEERRAKRLRLVEEHVRFENEHDLDAILGTFGADPRYDDEPWGEHHRGTDGVHTYYRHLMHAVPDLAIDIRQRHVTNDAVLLEVLISGTHLGAWRGLPPTGRRVAFPLCAIYTFDAHERLAGERIYYDRASVLHQLGVFRDPESVGGRVMTTVTHPITITRAAINLAARSFRRMPGSDEGGPTER